MTVHKAQGRTILRVVLDLTKRPSRYQQIDFAALFVAMSRVKEGNHIRLLGHDNLQYLTTIRPSRVVMAFYHGYEPTPSMEMLWKPSRALEYSRQTI
jgi:hypothetical protein